MMPILRKAILHEECLSHDVSDLVVTEITQCTCFENEVYKKIAEEYHSKKEVANIEGNGSHLMSSLVLALSSALLLSLLHTHVYSDFVINGVINDGF